MKGLMHAVKKTSKKTIAVVLSAAMVFSVGAVGASITASGALGVSTIYLDVSKNTDWQGKKLVAKFERNGSTATQTFTATNKDNIYKASAMNGATKVTVIAYPNDYPLELAEASHSGYRVITKTSLNKSYIYTWSSGNSDQNAAWPGVQMKTSGSYYYYDIPNTAGHDKVIFNVGSDSSKTGDLTAVYDSNNSAYYDGSAFQSSTSTSIDISSVTSSQNFFVMDDNGALGVSRYQCCDNGVVIPNSDMKTVYLYNPSWSNAYVTYDLSDVYQVTTQMTQSEKDDVKFYSASVPKNAIIRFQKTAASSNGASANLTIPQSDNPIYIMDNQKQWGTYPTDLPEKSNRVPNNFGSGIFGAQATYFDYMSDAEIENGYLNRTEARTDDPFKKYLNKAISDYSSNKSITKPIYFGNLYGIGSGAYKVGTDSKTTAYNYDNVVNNSAVLQDGHYWLAVQGLASSSLVNNRIYAPSSSGSAAMPIFDADWLTDGNVNGTGKTLAKVFDSYFPFRETVSEGITTYTFDSSGGGVRDSNGNVTSTSRDNSDNVYFSWAGKDPIAVNYSKGKDAYGNTYVINDGSSSGGNEFNVDGTGFGIFPFNNTNNTKSTSESGTVTVPSNQIWVKSNKDIYCHGHNGDTAVVNLKKLNTSGYKDDNYSYYVIDTEFTENCTNFTLSDDGGWKGTQYPPNGGARELISNYLGQVITFSGSGFTKQGTQAAYDSVSRSGSEWNDYGFGIRLDMDFRVPEYGVLPSSSGASPSGAISVPSNEIWVKHNSQVYCYGHGGTEVGIASLGKNSYGYYVIDSKYIGKSTYFILSESSNWLNQFPSSSSTAHESLSNYTGNIIEYSTSGFKKVGTAVDSSGNIMKFDPVTFKYSGDDDLWVYISDDAGNSELVLDLGGDHKFTSGEINFNTMISTSDFVQVDYNTTSTEKVKVPAGEFWVLKKGFNNLVVKTWNKLDENGNPYDDYIAPYGTTTYTFSDGSQDEFFKFKIADLDGALEFTINDASEGNKELSTLKFATHTINGQAFVLNKRAEGYLAEGYTHAINKNEETFPRNNVQRKFFGGNHLDPNKTYHMTVFYMERGLIESNFQVSFTMTPVKNNLTVDKEVEIPSGINNNTIRKAVYDNETFSYTGSNSVAVNMSGKTYTHTDKNNRTRTGTLDSNGSFALKDQESVYFVSQFENGSSMTVTESAVSNLPSGYNISDRYSTSWTYNGNGTKQGTGTTANIVLSGEDESENAELQLSYKNKLKLGNLGISKKVVSSSGADISNTINDDFSFNVKLDLNGGTDYKTYPLNYKVTTGGATTSHYSSSGVIAFSPKATVTIEGLPAGAAYQITENDTKGYSLKNDECSNTSGTIVAEAKKTASFVNQQSNGEGKITVNKTLDGNEYSGDQFAFKMTGLASADLGDGSSTVDTSTAETVTTSTVTNGVITFKVKFAQIGTYRYKIVEDKAASKANATLDGYEFDSDPIYVQFEVKAEGSNLVIDSDSVKYFADDEFSAQYQGFVGFANSTKHASITVNKTDGSGNIVEGTTFGLIKVTGSSSVTPEKINNLIKNHSDKITKGATVKKGSKASVTFEELPIYQNGDQSYNLSQNKWVDSKNYILGASVKQTYMLFEYSPSTGYNTNYTVKFFTFPHESKYDVTMNYVNTPVFMPASGFGAHNYLVAGSAILLTGAFFAMAYFAYGKSKRRREKVRVRSNRRYR